MTTKNVFITFISLSKKPFYIYYNPISIFLMQKKAKKMNYANIFRKKSEIVMKIQFL